MEGNEECVECQEIIGDVETVYECDACEAILHKACAGLTSSEGKCMPLQRRTLRLLCSKSLKEVVLNANNEMKEEHQNKEERKIKYSEAVSIKKKEEVVVIKPKDDTQRSSITKQNVQQVVDPATLGDGVGVSKLKYVRKGGQCLAIVKSQLKMYAKSLRRN